MALRWHRPSLQEVSSGTYFNKAVPWPPSDTLKLPSSCFEAGSTSASQGSSVETGFQCNLAKCTESETRGHVVACLPQHKVLALGCKAGSRSSSRGSDCWVPGLSAPGADKWHKSSMCPSHGFPSKKHDLHGVI